LLGSAERRRGEYCLAAHTVVGKMHGFTDDPILEIRRGKATFDGKLNALARLVQSITVGRGRADQALVEAFFDAGWTKENLVDAIVVIGDKTVTNYLHSVTKVRSIFLLRRNSRHKLSNEGLNGRS
jgi:alkylhydroperoxidase family enzyme